MPRAIFALLLSSCVVLADDEPEQPAVDAPLQEPQTPAVEDLGGGKFKVGLVSFDRATRAISFPAEVNMQEGPLEYAIVHRNGKIHESVLITRTRPFHLNLALKLLDYQESKELFPILDDDYRPTGKFPEVPEETKNAARAEILLNWKSEDGQERQASLNDWVTYTVTGKALPPLPWVYGGSYFHERSFQAEASGDIVALFTNNGSLFNWPGEDHHLDDVWLPATERIPEVGTPVTVTIKPFLNSKSGGAPANPERTADEPQPAPLAPEPVPGAPATPRGGPSPLPLPEPKEPARKDQL